MFNLIKFRSIIFLLAAFERAQKDIVEYLLAKGADVNFKYKNGFTALHYGE
jgi:ankyrin repeat protein